MNSIYPTNLPGFVYYHDPTKLDYKKSSMQYQDKKLFGEIEPPKSYSLPSTYKFLDILKKVLLKKNLKVVVFVY